MKVFLVRTLVVLGIVAAICLYVYGLIDVTSAHEAEVEQRKEEQKTGFIELCELAEGRVITLSDGDMICTLKDGRVLESPT